MPSPKDEDFVFMVAREVGFVNGSVATVPLQTFGSQRDAVESAKALDKDLAGLLPMELVEVSGSRVRKAGLSAKEMLADLGIVRLDHSVSEVLVAHSSRIENLSDGEEVSPGGIITRARH